MKRIEEQYVITANKILKSKMIKRKYLKAVMKKRREELIKRKENQTKSKDILESQDKAMKSPSKTMYANNDDVSLVFFCYINVDWNIQRLFPN